VYFLYILYNIVYILHSFSKRNHNFLHLFILLIRSLSVILTLSFVNMSNNCQIIIIIISLSINFYEFRIYDLGCIIGDYKLYSAYYCNKNASLQIEMLFDFCNIINEKIKYTSLQNLILQSQSNHLDAMLHLKSFIPLKFVKIFFFLFSSNKPCENVSPKNM